MEGASAVVESGGVELVGLAGELAVSAGAAVSEGAAVAGEVILEVVAGIFDSL